MKFHSTQSLIAKIFMWVAWALLVLFSVMCSHFLARDGGTVNTFDRSLTVFDLGLMIGPISVWMAWRFLLLPRLRSPWVQLVLYGIGLFFSQQIMMYGIFLVREYQVVFYVLCGVAMLAYIPYWVHPHLTEPKSE